MEVKDDSGIYVLVLCGAGGKAEIPWRRITAIIAILIPLTPHCLSLLEQATSDLSDRRQPRPGTFRPCVALKDRGPDLIDSPSTRKGILNLLFGDPAGTVPARLKLTEGKHEIGPSRFQDLR